MNGAHAIFYRDYRQRLTNITLLIWDLLAPLAYLLLFGSGFERMMGEGFTIEGQSVGYTSFLLAGVLAMVTFSVAMNSSWSFFADKDSGIAHELLTYPITREHILLGKIGFNVVMVLLGSVVVIAMAAVVLSVPVRWSWLPLLAIVTVVATAGWFFVFSAFAVALSRMDVFYAVTSAAYIFLMFFSSMFYPLNSVPQWFKVLSYLNPLTWQTDLARFALLGVGERTPLLCEGAALSVFCGVCLAFAVRALNRTA
ncbi:MAG: ABC transporter permease [Gammaproteobacteria bacterium]